jgi:hypothetical protein
MPSVQEGLNEGAGIEVNDLETDEGFSRHLAEKVRASEGNDSGSSSSAERLSEVRRDERLREANLGRRHLPDADSADEIKASVLDPGNDRPDVQAELARQLEPEQKTGRQLADEAIERLNSDPEQQAFRERQQQTDAAAEAWLEGTVAEVQVRRVDKALEIANETDDPSDWAQWDDAMHEFAAESPAAFEAYISAMDEAVYQQADEEGLSPDDEWYPSDEEMPSVAIGERIKRNLAHYQVEAEYNAQTQAEADALDRNIAEYESAVHKSGFVGKGIEVITDDGKAKMTHPEVLDLAADYIRDSGFDLDAAIMDNGKLAAEVLIEGVHQLAQANSARRKALHTNRWLEQPGTSVAEELARDARKLRGENQMEVPPLKPFDASKIGKRPKAEAESSSFKGMRVQRDKEGNVVRSASGAVKLAPGSLDAASGAKATDVASGLTIAGKPVSLDVASRTTEDEIRARYAATKRHFRA